MLYPGPTGGFAELFPSPVKGHDPGLSDEQNAEAQALVSAQVTLLQGQIDANAAQTTVALAGKEATIAEGGLAQSKVQGLTSALAGKEPTIAEGGLAQNKVQGLISDLAGKEPTIAEGGLAQSKVQNLVAALAERWTVAPSRRPTRREFRPTRGWSPSSWMGWP